MRGPYREQLGNGAIARFGLDEVRPAGPGEFVVAASRSCVVARFLVCFPVCTDQAERKGSARAKGSSSRQKTRTRDE